MMTAPKAMMVTITAAVSFIAAIVESIVDPNLANGQTSSAAPTIVTVSLAAIGLTLAVVKLMPIFLKSQSQRDHQITIGSMTLPAFREEVRGVLKDAQEPLEKELQDNTSAIRENTRGMNEHKNAVTTLIELEKADQRGRRR